MRRLENFIENLRSRRIGCAVLLKSENIYYLTGFYPSSFSVLIVEKEPLLLLNPMDANRAEDIDIPFRVVRKFSRFLKQIKSKRVGVELDTISYGFYRKYLSNRRIVDLKFLKEMRMVKSKEEIKLIKKGCRLTGEIISRLEFEGKSEREIRAELEYEISKRADVAFPTIVAGDRNSANPHHMPGEEKIFKNLIVDCGAKINHYCSDITRSINIAREKFEEVAEAVREAQKAAIKLCKPGVKAGEVDREARAVLKEYKLEEYFLHSLGHGIGLEVHEPPRLKTGSEEVLKEGMVVTVEPGVYTSFGVRIEDVVVVGKNPEVISR